MLVTAIGAGVERLRNRHIDVLLPEKIKTLANVDTVCFDKTGTLTATTVSPLLQLAIFVCRAYLRFALAAH